MRNEMIEKLTKAYLQNNKRDIENLEGIMYEDEINRAKSNAKNQGWAEKKYEYYIADAVEKTADTAGKFLADKNYKITGNKVIESGKNIADKIANSNLEEKIDKGVDIAKGFTKKAGKSFKKELNRFSRWLDDKTKE